MLSKKTFDAPQVSLALAGLRSHVQSQSTVNVEDGLAHRRLLFDLARDTPDGSPERLLLQTFEAFEAAIVQVSPELEERRSELLARIDQTIASVSSGKPPSATH